MYFQVNDTLWNEVINLLAEVVRTVNDLLMSVSTL